VEAYSRRAERKALVHKLAARSPSSPKSPKSPSSAVVAGAKAGGSVTQRYRYFSSQRAFVRLRLLISLHPLTTHPRTLAQPHFAYAPHPFTPLTFTPHLYTPHLHASPLHPSPLLPLTFAPSQGAPTDRPRRGAAPVSRGGAAAPAAARAQCNAAAPHDLLPARPIIGPDAAGAAGPDPPAPTPRHRARPYPNHDPDPDPSPIDPRLRCRRCCASLRTRVLSSTPRRALLPLDTYYTSPLASPGVATTPRRAAPSCLLYEVLAEPNTLNTRTLTHASTYTHVRSHTHTHARARAHTHQARCPLMLFVEVQELPTTVASAMLQGGTLAAPASGETLQEVSTVITETTTPDVTARKRERWDAKVARIRKASELATGNSGWKLTSMFVKSNDDLRQEVLGMQPISLLLTYLTTLLTYYLANFYLTHLLPYSLTTLLPC